LDRISLGIFATVKFSATALYGCAAGFDLRGSSLFNRGNHNVVALRAGSVEHQEGEASVARDDAEFGV